MPTEKSLFEASRHAESDPHKALSLLDQCAASSTRAASVVIKAKVGLIRAQVAVRLNMFSDSIQAEVQEAAATFAANHRHEEWCQAMGLLASLAFSRGNIPLTIAASIQGFREARASSSTRLLAARGALWALSHQPGELADTFIREVRHLAGTADKCLGLLVAKSYLAWRDFKRLLLDAGIATDSHPYPPSPAPLTLHEARRATRALIDEMQALQPDLRAVVRQEPVPLLFLAGMKGFVDGAQATRELALEVLRECGAPAEASVHSVIGVAHCRHGEFENAKRHLLQAIEGHRRDGRAHLGLTWFFYLAQACSGLGQYQEAFDALNRFHRGRQPLIDPFLYQQMLENAMTQMRIADTDLEEVERPPRHIQPVPPYLKKALQWMEQHLHLKVTAPDVVRISGVSRRTLESAFRVYSETSIMEQLRIMRLRRARRLFREEGASVASVMKKVGYTNPSAFSRDFRKVFGVAPSSV